MTEAPSHYLPEGYFLSFCEVFTCHIESQLLSVFILFFDIQNLYLSVKAVWRVKYPNFDPVALSELIVSKNAVRVRRK